MTQFAEKDKIASVPNNAKNDMINKSVLTDNRIYIYRLFFYGFTHGFLLCKPQKSALELKKLNDMQSHIIRLK